MRGGDSRLINDVLKYGCDVGPGRASEGDEGRIGTSVMGVLLRIGEMLLAKTCVSDRIGIRG